MSPAFLIGYFAVPLLCWSLLARTRAVGWIWAVQFAALGVIAGSMASGWASGEQDRGQAGTVLKVTVVLLLAGVVIESRRPGVDALKMSARNRAGKWLSLIYCASMPLLMFILYGSGLVFVEPSSDVLPLASGLSVISDSAGCTPDPAGGYDCERTILARGPRSEPVKDLILAEVRQLNLAHGWDLTQAVAPAMSTDGYGLWETGMLTIPVVSVTATSGTVSITLTT
jgi:hypothetical protein